MGSSLISLLPIFHLLVLLGSSVNAYWPPSPGYWPSSKVGSLNFYKGFRNLWGPQHQRMDQNALTIWLDRTSGTVIKLCFSFSQMCISNLIWILYVFLFIMYLGCVYIYRKWIQVSEAIQIRLLWSIHQTPTWIHCWSHHISLCES